MKKNQRNNDLFCSFCGKSQSEVAELLLRRITDFKLGRLERILVFQSFEYLFL